MTTETSATTFSSTPGTDSQPQPEATDEYPDRTPLPEPVATPQAQQLGQLAADAVPDAGLEVVEALELNLSDTTVTQILLVPRVSGNTGSVTINIFRDATTPTSVATVSEGATSDDLSGRLSSPGNSPQEISIPGASKAYLVTGAHGDRIQILARLSNQMVVNVSLEGAIGQKLLLLDRLGVEKITSALVQQVR
jgi:hypothetical protein